MKYYAVRRGKKTGIFSTAKEFKESIKECEDSEYKIFKSEKEAEMYIARYRRAQKPMLSHIHTPAASTKEKEAKATCETDGYYEQVVKCSICGEEISRKTVTVPATGHDWGKWVQTKAPTETTEGELTRMCKNDETHKETRIIQKLEPNPVTDDKDNTQAGDNTTPVKTDDTKTTEAPEARDTSKTTEALATKDTSKTTETPAAKDTTLTDESTNATFIVTSSEGEEPTVEYIGVLDVIEKIVTIPETITVDDVTYKVTEIANKAYANNKTLEKVVISNNIESIGDGAFSGCTNLKSVSIPASVTEIGDTAFANCTALTKVIIPAKVTKIKKNAFKNNRKLKTIIIKSKKIKSIGKNAFKNINKKATFYLPKKLTKKQLAKYKKMIKKAGISKSVKIKKK